MFKTDSQAVNKREYMLAANQKEEMDEWLAEICKCMEEDQGSTSQRCVAEIVHVYDCLANSSANKNVIVFLSMECFRSQRVNSHT